MTQKSRGIWTYSIEETINVSTIAFHSFGFLGGGVKCGNYVYILFSVKSSKEQGRLLSRMSFEGNTKEL